MHIMHRRRSIGEEVPSSSSSSHSYYGTRSRRRRRFGTRLLLASAFAFFKDADVVAAASAAPMGPKLTMSVDERHHVLVNGVTFLSIAPFLVRMFNRTSTGRLGDGDGDCGDGGDLRVLSRSTTIGVDDVRGEYVSRTIDWTDDRWPPVDESAEHDAGGKSEKPKQPEPYYRTSTIVYPDRMAVEFQQTFPRGVPGCDDHDYLGSERARAMSTADATPGAPPLRATFPTFHVDAPPDDDDDGTTTTDDDGNGDGGALSYFIYESVFLEHQRSGFFLPNTSLPLGVRTGPMLLFRHHTNVGIISAVLSHSNEFMTQSVVHDGVESTLSFGPMGTLCDLPPGYSTKTILVIDTSSVLSAARNWGSMLLGNMTRNHHDDYDYASSHLGYSTDNGAYYYYHREPTSPNMEDTLLKVADHARDRSIPYRYWLLDSWWYYKDVTTGGVTNWTARPDVFPTGLDGLYDRTGGRMLVQAHNRYWSPHPSYESTYPFVHSDNNSTSLPVGKKFWLDLFRGARERWGLRVYEQDWLNVQFERLTQSFTDPTLLRSWLIDMGEAAAQSGIAIQYCMPLGRHLLQSTEIPSVTQIRATDDYVTENQWDVGVTSLLHWALRLRPSKDSAWSTREQPGNPYGKGRRVETSPKLQAYVMALSTGPVAFSDRIGHSDRDLILKTCREDGVLLRTVQPPIAIHEWFHRRSLGDDIGCIRESKMRVEGIPSPYFVILAVNLTRPFVLEPRHLHEFPDDSHSPPSSPSGSHHPDGASVDAPSPPPRYVAYTVRDGVGVGGGEWMERPFSSDRPLTLEATVAATRSPTSKPANNNTLDDFWCWYVAPVFRGGWVVYGEMDKIVPIAAERISRVECERHGQKSSLGAAASTSDACELLRLQLRGAPGERIDLTLGRYQRHHHGGGGGGPTVVDVDGGDGDGGGGGDESEVPSTTTMPLRRGKCTVVFSSSPLSSSSSSPKNGEVEMVLVVNASRWPNPDGCRAVPTRIVEDEDMQGLAVE